MLEVAGPVVESRVLDPRIVDEFRADPARPAGPPPDPDLGTRQERLDLADIADDRQLLGCSDPSANMQRSNMRAGSLLVLDDHVGIVEDVRRLAVVPLVEMVHVLAPGGEDAPGRAPTMWFMRSKK